MKNRRIFLASILMALTFSPAHALRERQVVASIKPLHSLVANITKGISSPRLVLRGQASPHTYTLKPSDVSALAKAKVIFWMGPQVETFLQKPLALLAPTATVVAFLQPDHDSKTDDHSTDAHDHSIDPHTWLNPLDAQQMVKTIAATLIKADPDNAAKYRDNLQQTLSRIDRLDKELAVKLRGTGPILVFHNAYSHLAERYNITIAGVLVDNPELTPGAGRIREIRQMIKSKNGVCIFSEPQFNTKIIKTITSGTKLKAGTLDPIASDLEPGPELYFTMMQQMADSLAICR